MTVTPTPTNTVASAEQRLGRIPDTVAEAESTAADAGPDAAELRDFSRTVGEIEWLLVILVLLFHIFHEAGEDHAAAIYGGLVVYSAFVIGFHYYNISRRPGLWSLAVETWLMIVFITWLLFHTGRLDSPLLNLYLLPIVTSALTLGQKVTLLQFGLIAACYVFLGHATGQSLLSTVTAGNFAAGLAPMLLVAYITTMLSQDISNAMARIRLISETDELTRAYNMRAFNAIGRRECTLADRYNRTLSLLMIDSDNLKKVNDTYGHEAGDELIRHVARCLRSDLRTTDVFARYGGDEFVCLLPETGSKGALIVAERVRGRIAGTALRAADRKLHTTVSIGVATYREHATSFEILARNADQALYASKAAGRDRVTVFAPE